MGYCNGRYGLEPKELTNLNHRWNHGVRQGEGWESFEDFLLWCIKNGYERGKQLRKKDPEAPHGPENSFFFRSGERTGICADCVNKCGGQGCRKWREWYADNWDENIHREQMNVVKRGGKEYFQYEHPDLVREGIVWGN